MHRVAPLSYQCDCQACPVPTCPPTSSYLVCRCSAGLAIRSAAVSTTIHRDGTVTYHFSGEGVQQATLFSNGSGQKEVLGVSKGVLEASALGHQEHTTEDVSGTGVDLPKGVVLPGLKARSLLNELHGNTRVSQQPSDRAQTGARRHRSTASRNGYSKKSNGVSANSLLHLDVPTLLTPRPEEDRLRQHQRAGFSGRHAEVHFAPRHIQALGPTVHAKYLLPLFSNRIILLGASGGRKWGLAPVVSCQW